MKKNRIVPLLLAAVLLAFALPMTVSAAPPTVGIVINPPAGHSYAAGDEDAFKAYKIFDVTYSGSAFAYTLNPLFDDFEDYPTFGAQTLLQYLQDQTDQSKAMAGIAQALYAYIVATPVPDVGSVSLTGTQIVIDLAKSEDADAGPGYYLVYSSISVDEAEIVAACVLTTTAPVATVTQKADVPEISKGVAKTSSGTPGAFTTVNIGDDAFFTITSRVPAMIGYKSYAFTVGDKMSSQLAFHAADSDMTVKIGTKTLTAGVDYDFLHATSTPMTAADGYTFQVVFKNFIDYAHEHVAGCYEDGDIEKELECELVNRVGQTITITYKAKLAATAVIGAPGQQNTADLTYSNDPGTTSAGNPGSTGSTGKTPETPPVKVYTFDFEVKKVDEQNNARPGAVFTLKPFIGGTASSAITFFETAADSGIYRVATAAEITADVRIGTALTSPAGGAIHIDGLDEGKYVLTETQAPDGYNKLTYDIMVKITHTGSGDYTAAFQHSGDGFVSSWDGITASAPGMYEYKIVNSTGPELPGTGGIGEKLFIVGGLAIVVIFAAAIAAYRRKRVLIALKKR